MQLSEDDFNTADFKFRVFVNGHTSAVVTYSCNAVVKKLNCDSVAEAVCHFVNAVVNDFP